jgi:hypothetical protein
MHGAVHMIFTQSSTIEIFSEVSLLRILSRDIYVTKTGLHDRGTVSGRDIEGSLLDHYVETGLRVRLPIRLHRVPNVKIHGTNPYFLCMPSQRVA